MRVYLLFGGWKGLKCLSKRKGLKCDEFDQENSMLDGFDFECFGNERRKKDYIGKKRKRKKKKELLWAGDRELTNWIAIFCLHCSIISSRTSCYWDFVAVSHNVQQLQISITCDIQQFPPCLFLCRTLTSLRLCVHCRIFEKEFTVVLITRRSFFFLPNSPNLHALSWL